MEIIKVLLVDDDEEDYILTRDVIEDIPHKKYQLDWVSTYEEAMKSVKQNRHDVYLVDYRLGAHTGLEVISEAIGSGCYKPLILLTGQGDVEIDEKATRAGAADYLIKGNINPYQLERSIRYSIRDARNLEEIRKLNVELEKRVEQRTQELKKAVKDLEQKEKEISIALEKERELNELKSKFVTIASHEFRTPLSTILSSASLISRYNDDTEKREKHISRIKSAVNNLTGILNDFLSISKLEEGKVSGSPEKFDIIEFSRDIVEEMQAVAQEYQQISYNHQGEETMIIMDKQMLKNVLINLLSNAIKYSPKGTDVDFTTEITRENLRISIKDRGIGIPEEDKPHLFSRFFRAGNAGNIQGTGLGLNIVKKYIDLMKGTIDYTSEAGKGTEFTVVLPVRSHLTADS